MWNHRKDILNAINTCTHTTKYNSTKHYDSHTKFARMHVDMETWKLKYVITDMNLTDSFTKLLDVREH